MAGLYSGLPEPVRTYIMPPEARDTGHKAIGFDVCLVWLWFWFCENFSFYVSFLSFGMVVFTLPFIWEVYNLFVMTKSLPWISKDTFDFELQNSVWTIKTMEILEVGLKVFVLWDDLEPMGDGHETLVLGSVVSPIGLWVWLLCPPAGATILRGFEAFGALGLWDLGFEGLNQPMFLVLLSAPRSIKMWTTHCKLLLQKGKVF